MTKLCSKFIIIECIDGRYHSKRDESIRISSINPEKMFFILVIFDRKSSTTFNVKQVKRFNLRICQSFTRCSQQCTLCISIGGIVITVNLLPHSVVDLQVPIGFFHLQNVQNRIAKLRWLFSNTNTWNVARKMCRKWIRVISKNINFATSLNRFYVIDKASACVKSSSHIYAIKEASISFEIEFFECALVW